MKKIIDIEYGRDEMQKLDIYLPDSDRFPVFLYFHGGGLECGDRKCDAGLYEYLVSNGIAVVTAEYRMYPSAKYPDFLEDAASATAWVLEHIREYGNVTGIYVGGSSAGGYLGQMLCFNKALLAKHDKSPLDIDGFVLDAGQPTSHYNILREKPIDTRRVIVDETAPLYYVGLDEKYTDMLIVVSDDDMPCRYEQTLTLVATLKNFGHTDNVTLKVMHGKHCAYVKKTDAEGNNVLGKIVHDYILKKCGSGD